MNDELLRRRISRLDPADAASTEPVTSTSARALLEDIMSTDTETPTPAAAPTPSSGRPRPRWPAITGTAAAVVAIVAVGLTAGGAFDGDDGDDQIATDPPATTGADRLTVLELSTGEVDPMMMSCLQMTPDIIAGAEVAFRATATTVDGEMVTLTVDQWYTGGDEGAVTLTAPDGMEALIGGIDFQVGQPYLVAATDGVVNYCGMTGPATPELQQLYDQAFPA